MQQLKLHVLPGDILLPNLRDLSFPGASDWVRGGEDTGFLFCLFAFLTPGVVKFCAAPPSPASTVAMLSHMQLMCRSLEEISVCMPTSPCDFTPMLASFPHLHTVKCLFLPYLLVLQDLSLRALGSLPSLKKWVSDARFVAESFASFPSAPYGQSAVFFPVLEELDMDRVIDLNAFSDFLASLDSTTLRRVAVRLSNTALLGAEFRKFSEVLAKRISLQSIALTSNTVAGAGSISWRPLYALKKLEALRHVELIDIIAPRSVTDDEVQHVISQWPRLETFHYETNSSTTGTQTLATKLTAAVLPIFAISCPRLASLTLPIDWTIPLPFTNTSNGGDFVPRRSTSLCLTIATPSAAGKNLNAATRIRRTQAIAEIISDTYPNIHIVLPNTPEGPAKSAWDEVTSWMVAFGRVRRMERERILAETKNSTVDKNVGRVAYQPL